MTSALSAQNLLALYGDSDGREVFAIDVDNMALIARIPTGEGPYPVDRVGDDLLYAITRKEASVTPIAISTLSPGSPIALTHRPRSATRGPGASAGLILVSGADRPLTSIVDGATGTVVMRVGRDITGTVDGFGGSLASGHEHWIDDERFFVLDRFAPTIAIYNLRSSGIPVWISETPGPVHHVRPDPEFPGRWYAACEGRPASGIPPSIVVMEADPAAVGGFRVTAVVELPIAAADLRDSGAHHVDIAPGGGLLFVGSAEGNTYGLRRDTLTFVYKGRTGLGCGHTGFVAINGVTRAVTINHFATFVSVLDTKTGQNIIDIEVSNTSSTTRRTQGHTSFVRGEKFYMMASLDADFVEIDLASGAVTRRLNLGISGQRPYPMQGVFVTPPNARMAEGTGRLLTQCC